VIQSSEIFIRKLTHILVINGAIDAKAEHQFDEAFKKSAHESYEMFLLDEGLVEPNELLNALSQCYKVPSFDVSDYFFEHNLLHFFPKDFLLRNAVIPAELDEDMLVLVTSDPSDADLARKINEFVSYDVRFCVGIYRDICDAIEEFYDYALTQKNEDGLDDLDTDSEVYEFEIDEEGAVIDEDIDEI